MIVPKLVLILSGRICNAIYRNYDKAHIFCSALSLTSTCERPYIKQISSYSWFSENSCTYRSKKRKGKEWTKTQIYSLTSPSLSEAIHLTYSFSKYRMFAAKHATNLSNHFFYGAFKLLLWNVSEDRLDFLDRLGICNGNK